MSAAGDGASGDGGSTQFINPVEMIPRDDLPWGTLGLYGHDYDPWSLSSLYEYMSVDQEIMDALFSENLYAIRVALFDTGVDTSHAKLRKKIAGGIDLVYGTDGIPDDDNGHGTHVAGTLCGKDLGILLYNPLELHVVKVLDKNAIGEVSTLVRGMRWAIENRMDIINLSVAYAEDSPALKAAVKKVHEAGIVMVGAVGNHSNWDLPAPTASADGGSADGGSADGGSADGGSADGGSADGGSADGGSVDGISADGGSGDGGSSSATVAESNYPVMFPAFYEEVIAVGAVDAFGETASFSNEGPEMDFLAPGVNVFSTNLNGGYGICSGTSMAIPHITGAVAMLLARARDLDRLLSPDEVKQILQRATINFKIDLAFALEEIVYGR